MPKMKDTVMPDKVNLFSNQDQMMQRILIESKKEVEKLNQQREMLILTNRQIEDDIARKTAQFEQWKRLEEQKVQDMKNKFKNDEINCAKKIEIGELDLLRRQEEMAKREKLGIEIVEKSKKLNEERIDIEKLRSNANSLMDTANRKFSEASTLFSQATQSEIKAKEMVREANLINENLVRRENLVREKEKEIEINTKNLEQLKVIVEPKIEELKHTERNIDNKKKDLLKREEEVTRKINEENVLIKSIQIEKAKLDERKKELDEKEQEITRKVILNQVKNV